MVNEEVYAKKIGVKVGEGCRLLGCDYSTEPYLIQLGNHVSATKVRFETHDGGVWVIRGCYPLLDVVKGIKIGNNVYIGYGAIILPGVEVEDNVVIGAGAIVTKSLKSGGVYAGVPAKYIKSVEEYANKSKESGSSTKAMSAADKKAFYERFYKDIWC